MDEAMEARHLVELGYLEEIFTALGYTGVVLHEKSAEVPYHTLTVSLAEDTNGRKKELALTFYPATEFENTMFLQYFIELPFTIVQKQLADVARLLPYINNRLVLGHFGISEGDSKLHFRYVQTLNADDLVTRERVEDAINLTVFTPVMFENALEDLATRKISFERALTRINENNTQVSSVS